MRVLKSYDDWKQAVATDGAARDVAVDLNGVLNEYRGWKRSESFEDLRVGAREFLAQLASTNRLILCTARSNHPGLRAWLQLSNLERYFWAVTNVKLPWSVLVDDRVVRHGGDFEATLREVETFKPWWER